MSIINICNRALSTYIGQGQITSLSDNSPAATACDLHYDEARKYVLCYGAHPWTWATKRQSLAELTNDRSTEWGFKYQAPVDLLQIVWVNTPIAARMAKAAHENPDTDREFAGGVIYSDVEDAVMEYIADEDDVTTFPPIFQDALAAELASRIAMVLTQNVRIAQNAGNMARQLLDSAQASDALNLPPMGQGMPSWLTARGIS